MPTQRKSLLQLDDEVYGGMNTATPPTPSPSTPRPKKSLLELDDEIYGGVSGTQPTVKQDQSKAQKVLNNPILRSLEKTGETIGNFGVGVAKGIMDAPRLAAEGGAKLGDLMNEIQSGQPQQPNAGFTEATKPIPAFQPQNATQKAGYNTEKVAEFFAPGLGASKGAGLLTKFLSSSADVGTRTLAQGKELKEAATDAALAGGGEIVGKGLGLIGDMVSPALRRSAEEVYAQVLRPTTVENKAITQKIVPELLDRGTKGFTRESLLSRFQKEAAKSGKDIESALSEIPAGSTVNTSSILSRLDETKKNFMVEGADGVSVAADPQAVKHIEDLQEQIRQMSSNVGSASYAPFESVRKFRQILDRNVADAKGFYGKTLAEGSLTEAKKEAADAIREELAKEYPNLAKVNAEYNFWSNAQKVLEHTVRNKQGQARPLTETLRRTAGAVTGGVVGGPGGAVVGDIVTSGLSQLLDSAGWKTLGSIQKARIAKLLGDGKLEEVAKYTSRLMAGMNKQGSN